MRVFVTGASGHIASALVPELIAAGHDVVGLARSDQSADVLTAMGAEVRRGGLRDLDALGEAAATADAVVHLAFDHAAVAAGKFPEAVATDLAAVQALGQALVGTGKALLGIGLTRTGNPERDATIDANPRSAVARAINDYAKRDVRTVLVAIPPVTHSARDRHGFIPTLIAAARRTGVSAYVGEGANRWPAGHVLDVAHLYRLALANAPAGSQLFAATEAGIPVREIADTIGRHLELPTQSISAAEAAEHFTGFPFIALDITMDNTGTRQLLDWTPVHPGLLADLDDGHYFATR